MRHDICIYGENLEILTDSTSHKLVTKIYIRNGRLLIVHTYIYLLFVTKRQEGKMSGVSKRRKKIQLDVFMEKESQVGKFSPVSAKLKIVQPTIVRTFWKRRSINTPRFHSRLWVSYFQRNQPRFIQSILIQQLKNNNGKVFIQMNFLETFSKLKENYFLAISNYCNVENFTGILGITISKIGNLVPGILVKFLFQREHLRWMDYICTCIIQESLIPCHSDFSTPRFLIQSVFCHEKKNAIFRLSSSRKHFLVTSRGCSVIYRSYRCKAILEKIDARAPVRRLTVSGNILGREFVIIIE